MKKAFFLFLFFLLAPVAGFTQSVAPLQMVEIFSIEENPGSGLLEYKAGDKTEKIDFGKKSGVYGLGMVFDGKTLPEPYRKDFTQKKILQIALGTSKSKLQGRIPQFAAVTLVAKAIPTARTTFQLSSPNSENLKKENIALLLFTSPQTKSEQSDEEKLKGTVFAHGGVITITPAKSVENIAIREQDKKIGFKRQMIRMEYQADLSTPFNTEKNTLKGAIEFPLYWPSSKEAEALASKVALESLAGVGAAPTKKTN